MQVRTGQKLVWLGCSFAESYRSWARFLLISNRPIHALLYSDPNTFGNFTVGAFPQRTKEDNTSVSEPILPQYQLDRPIYGRSSFDWYYSDAPLRSVVQVQLCRDQGFCIGLLLHYAGSAPLAVGQFRFDKVAGCVCDPKSIQYMVQRNESAPFAQVRIEVSHLDPENIHAATG